MDSYFLVIQVQFPPYFLCRYAHFRESNLIKMCLHDTFTTLTTNFNFYANQAWAYVVFLVISTIRTSK